ncbi:Hypothetical predicted protein [Paramuricea clavata]|uniref:Uncharacterized protein n=1 Tax=Paramuricea clavata TaxID=317549 RepID=A0A6S7HDE9_PARCT|nr:Hypothetical predicted protein [Paramuricea clavata]
MIKKKETLRRKIRRGTNFAALVQKYKKFRRTSKRLIKESREKFFGSLSGALPSNPKLFWSFFETTTKSSRIPQQVSVATGNKDSPRLDCTNQKQAAEMFNDYFHSVFLTEKVLLFQSPLHLKASGRDNIPIRLLKECAHSITPSLTCLFNKSLKQVSLPSEWNLSNIIPLHKKGIKSFVENYRPISLICVVAKGLERCVYNRLIGHIKNMISVAQHGFLRGKSCTGQLISVLHRISQNLDSGEQTDILYFDVAKAFDTVNHNLLLKKLQRFGLKANILTRFKSYLSGRQQRVLFNGEISETRSVSSGVP